MRRTTGITVGLVLAGLLGLVDTVSILTDTGDGPPLVIIVAGTVLGLLTLAGVWFGWRGSRAGIVTVVVTRLLSALSAVPAFFVDDVPGGLVALAGVGVVVTLVAVALVAPALRQPVRAEVA
jgi:hypothetical protein